MIKKGDTIPGIFSLAAGVFTLIYIFQNPKMVIVDEGVIGGVGPGFFPFICSAALIVCGLLLVLRGVKQNGTVDYFRLTKERKENLKTVGLLALLILLLLLAWKISGLFFVCLPIYIFAVNRLLKRSVKFTILFTVGMTAFIYVLFRMGFSIRFNP
ncbi:MAG: tripartite tricarboxylate transporter TctB family protein [Lachnospiraceae bacterium]|nr:tripartite tricarboxylate transporter TctB family protein [Lachnospiraceae bacterium]